MYLDFSLVWCLLGNTSPLKEFHKNNKINVAGNNTTVLKRTNHEYSSKNSVYEKERYLYSNYLYRNFQKNVRIALLHISVQKKVEFGYPWN